MVVKAAKPPKPRWRRIHDPIYGTQYTVCTGESRPNAFKRHCRVWDLGTPSAATLEMLGEVADVRASFNSCSGVKSGLLWFPEVPRVPGPRTASIVAHEAAHAALHCFGASGIAAPNHQESEAFCYYLDFLVEEIWKALWPGGKK